MSVSIAVEPINYLQQQQVREETLKYLQKAEKIYKRQFTEIPVLFDLKGRAAGQYRLRNGERVIRYNPYIFAKYFEDSLVSTVPHEVAHYVTDCLHGVFYKKPHGEQWRSVMQAFGVTEQRTASYDLTGIPMRLQRRYKYYCQCNVYQISTRRHNLIQKNQADYLCRHCKTKLRYEND